MEKAALLRITAAALALSIISSPAAAQLAPAGLSNLSLAKNEAILGGAPSRLAAIMAQQSGLPAPVATASLQPASPGVRPSYAAYRYRPDDSQALVSGRPDVFGSVALRVGRTSLDRRWRAAGRAAIGGAHAAYAQQIRDLDPVDRADAVNRYVNARVEFTDDWDQYGRNDLWTTAADTLRRGRGDCEDYAIAKLQLLRAAGIADSDLYLVIVKDLVRRSDHAVLVVRAGGRMLVLDNGTDRLVDTAEVSDYRPVLTFAASGAWTHGYRREVPAVVAPVQVAAATVAPAPLAPSAAR